MSPPWPGTVGMSPAHLSLEKAAKHTHRPAPAYNPGSLFPSTRGSPLCLLWALGAVGTTEATDTWARLPILEAKDITICGGGATFDAGDTVEGYIDDASAIAAPTAVLLSPHMGAAGTTARAMSRASAGPTGSTHSWCGVRLLREPRLESRRTA